ncbi:MAG: DNA primase [Bacteroidales bacterium]|nr:DNA primase [Bacteroidales bacterium]
MIPKDTIHDVLFAADMKDVAESCGVQLRKAGAVLYKGCCPFHNEKDGSFFVNTKYNRWHCYGCDRKGNAFDFLMELKGYSFVEAVKHLADRYNVTIEERTPTKEEEQQEKKRRQLVAVYEESTKFYEQCLRQTPEALQYALGRFDQDTLEHFRIGYAPNQANALYQHLRSKGFLFDLLEECDLFRKRRDSFMGDFFRDRLIFPISNLTGNVIAFSGRALHLGADVPKYINSSGNPLIYTKGGTLFGLNFAYRHIRNADMSVLVEGNADVVKMHQLGVCNVTAPCGTALTDEQIRLLGRASKNVTLMLDGDDAGAKATERNGKRLVESGMNVYVLEIPTKEDGSKQDPDSYFTSKEQFEEFQQKGKRLFIEALAEKRKQESAKDPIVKTAAVREISALFADRPIADRNSLIERLSKIIPGKNIWKQILKESDEARELQRQLDEKKSRQTLVGKTEEQEELIRKYGFYIEKNCYWFYSLKGDNFFKGSNFVMEPLFHIGSTINAKRLYRLKNVFNHVQVLEFAQKDLISIAAFKLRCESLGNFLFEGGEHGLNKIKAYLYDNTKTCREVTQLGWQKQGFFAWSNGITANGEFIPIGELGIVEHEGLYYYIPALSSFYKDEDTLFQFERKFIHRGGEISLFDFTDKLVNVYGENAIAGIGFYFATLFRDIFITTYRFFPILNIFGPKGTGKSEMAVTLLKLFGDLPVGINMTNSTVPAMADHVAHTRNTLCHIDEYKNSLEFEKIEFLKGLWDGVGRSRMNMEKDKKKEMTAVDAGIMLTGQEMTTADNALFSRVIFLSVSKAEFTEEERNRFEELKKIENKGLTHITNKLLSKRKTFLEKHVAAFNGAIADVTPHINRSQIEDRILKNWCIVLAALKIMTEEETLPFTYEKAVRTFARMITRQNGDVVAGNEVSDFWSIYQELFSSGFIEKDFDFQIKEVDELKTTTQTIQHSMKVLFMNPNRIFGLYAQQKRSANEKRLPKDSLKYYLKNSAEYLGQQQKRFRRNMKNLQDRESVKLLPGDGTVALEYERPYAWCFDYEKLKQNTELNLETDFVWEAKEEAKVTDDSPERPREKPPAPDTPKLFPY